MIDNLVTLALTYYWHIAAFVTLLALCESFAGQIRRSSAVENGVATGIYLFAIGALWPLTGIIFAVLVIYFIAAGHKRKRDEKLLVPKPGEVRH